MTFLFTICHFPKTHSICNYKTKVSLTLIQQKLAGWWWTGPGLFEWPFTLVFTFSLYHCIMSHVTRFLQSKFTVRLKSESTLNFGHWLLMPCMLIIRKYSPRKDLILVFRDSSAVVTMSTVVSPRNFMITWLSSSLFNSTIKLCVFFLSSRFSCWF